MYHGYRHLRSQTYYAQNGYCRGQYWGEEIRQVTPYQGIKLSTIANVTVQCCHAVM